MKKMKDFLIDESGQGMVEYALIISLIAAGLIAAVALLSGNISKVFEDSNAKLDEAK